MATHDWAASVDAGHLAEVRRRSRELAPGGALHLVLEVLAYAADEADALGSGRARVTLHADGSVSVDDDGRGTETRRDGADRPVRKPVMATRDLRFFEVPDPPLLPDGHARRGISVVAALSDWLVHENRRADGAWTQRYEHGVPVTDLLPLDAGVGTGTAVHFLPGATVSPTVAALEDSEFALLARWPRLAVEVCDERGARAGGRAGDAPSVT